jgi:heavy metal sensor kinase
MTSLSLRARLTLWYSVVLLAVLLAAGAAVVWLHSTLGLARIDRELQAEAATVNGVLRGEFEEIDPEPHPPGKDVQDVEDVALRVAEALHDLDLPGTGVAIFSRDGDALAVRTFGVRSLTPAELAAAGSIGTSVTPDVSSRGGLRLREDVQRLPGLDARVVVWNSLEPFEWERARLARALLLGVPLALLVASAGGWMVGYRGLRPLTDMARQAETITADRLDDRLSQPVTRDELGALASAFNALLDRLAGALRVQRQFMADASHQLRTPISIARTAAQVTLSQPERDAADYREALTIVATQTRRLTEMIERMFTLALADLDARPLQLTDFYLDELVQECARTAQVLAADRRLTIRAETPAEVPFRGDETLLRQMIMNLVENAVRHTPPAGTVALALNAVNGHVRVIVADTGCGIPAEHQARIFERFVRLQTAAPDGAGGLGLPIARWVAEAHHGSLTLESSGPTGSRFVVVLPGRLDATA